MSVEFWDWITSETIFILNKEQKTYLKWEDFLWDTLYKNQQRIRLLASDEW